MSDLRVICLSGVSGSGKDTVAKILDLHYGYKQLAQTDSIRSIFDDLNSWEIRKDFDGTRGISGEERSRDITVSIGTHCIADTIGESVDLAVLHWTQSVLAGIRYLNHYHIKKYNKFVISDVRFPSQSIYIKNRIGFWGGKVLSLGIEMPDVSIPGSSNITETSVNMVKINSIIYNSRNLGLTYSKSVKRLHEIIENTMLDFPEFL